MCGYVFHVAHILVAALDLEAANAGVDQCAQEGFSAKVEAGKQDGGRQAEDEG